jgi:hypothetical protein
MSRTLTAYVEYDRESNLYVGIVPGAGCSYASSDFR